MPIYPEITHSESRRAINKLSQTLYPRKIISLSQMELFYSKMAMGKRRLCLKNVYDVFPPKSGLLNINLVTPNKWFSIDSSYTKDIMTLCLLCKILNPRSIFEIGTLDGFTAYHFALNSSEQTEIFTLDLPKTYNVESKLQTTIMDNLHIDSYRKMNKYIFTGTPHEKKIKCLFGDSYKFDFPPYEKKIDLFFIDGAHSYQYVHSDSQKAFSCVREGGVVVWHDYGRYGINGVTKYLHELRKEREIFSVPGSSLAFTAI